MIKLENINPTDMNSLKRAIEKLARNAMPLQAPSAGDQVYLTAIPTADDLHEGQSALYFDGTNYRVYYVINGTVRYATLT